MSKSWWALCLVLVLLTTACQPVRDPFARVAVPGGAQFAAVAVEPLGRENLAARTPLARGDAPPLHPFAVLFPDLQTAAAPRWLRAGTRVTYEYMYANYALEPEDPTPSGAMLIQYDVIAQNRQTVVVLPTMISTQVEGAAPESLIPFKAAPGVGEFWFAPAVLPQALEVEGNEYSAFQTTAQVGDQEVEVMRIQYAGERGEEIWEFDLETGLMVFYEQTLYRADGSTSGGSVMTLVNNRRVQMPWRRATVPAWVTPRLTLEFQGTHTAVVGGSAPSAPSLPLELTVRFTKVGAGWTEYNQTLVVNGLENQSTPSATGVAQIWGGMWLPAVALDVLEAGDVLDRDPDTGIVVSVADRTADWIVLRAEGTNYLAELTYDAGSGQLVKMYRETHSWAASLYIELTATNW